MPSPPRRAPGVDLVLDKQSTLPLYLQLWHHSTHRIGSNVWQPDRPLPSVRQLAADLGLATATVQRAYEELQGLGILAGQAGRGVATRFEKRADNYRAILLLASLTLWLA